jgi:hypothetical protein
MMEVKIWCNQPMRKRASEIGKVDSKCTVQF